MISHCALKESIGVLKKQLPSEFIVNATIEAVSKNDRTTDDDFIANLNTDGVVQMKGFLPDQNSRIAVPTMVPSLGRRVSGARIHEY